ncbi:MAG TPA: PEP/pyruvate-binding domain-containing protein [Vicinamibacteria bacterium]
MLLSDAIASSATCSSEVGGKAWNLLRLREKGFLVPQFWIVPRAQFARTRVSPDLIAELGAALPASRLFAVRSSAVGEDSREHSFAGVLESVLNVPRMEVPAAIERVWASAFSARARSYRRRKGLSLEDTTTAVIVQEMVQPRCAGVLFTHDPADGARRVVISAGLGLGQGVVSDAVETDTFRIGWDDGAVSREVRTKRSRIVRADRCGGGTREEPVPRWRRGRPALRSSEVRRLRDAGRDIEQALGGPQDVEWALDAAGRLFVLQARPIVGGACSTREPVRIWDNANVVESYPGLTLPLTFSFARRSYERTFSHAAARFLALGGARPSTDVFASLIGLLDGRVYYNLLSWYEMFSYLPGSDRYRESWDGLIGVAQRSASPPSHGTRFAHAGAVLTSIAILLRVKSLHRRFFARFDALRARFLDAGKETTTTDVLATFRSIEEMAGAFWYLTIQNDFCVLEYHDALARLLQRWAPGHDPGLVNALLSGHESVESVAPVRSLLSLTEAVRGDPSALALFETDDDGAIWTAVRTDPRRQALRHAFQRHLDEFGDRSVGDLKLETVTFEQDPPRLIGLVKHSLRVGLSPTTGGARPGPATSAEDLRRTIRGAVKGRVFRLVLDRARAAIRAREDMRLARTRLFGMVRRLFLRLGGLLERQRILETASDVHYLTIEELLDLGRGTGVTGDLAGLVALRKADYARYAEIPAPPRRETTGIPQCSPVPTADAVPDARAVLKGTGCSAGIATGRAAVVIDPEHTVAGRDSILVARSTDPGWVFLMMSAAGIVVERGSLLSHTAIIGRELGIPTVVGAIGATTLIPEGAALRIDGSTGDVRWAS